MSKRFASILHGLVAAVGLVLFALSVGLLLWPASELRVGAGATSADGGGRGQKGWAEEAGPKGVEADDGGSSDSDALVVVLDPGHGGSDPGSVRDGHYEKDINLKIAVRVRKRLEAAGLRVVMTRTGDTTMELQDRVAVANRFRNALFVSIHQNASVESGARGIETYYGWPRPASVIKAQRERYRIPDGFPHEDPRARLLAARIQDSLCSSTKAPSRGLKNRNFVVIRWVHGPAVLVECGFLSHPDERKRLLSDDYRDRIAAGIADGVLGYAGDARGDLLFGLRFPGGAPPEKPAGSRRTVVQALPADS